MIYSLLNTVDALAYITYLLNNGFAFEVRPHAHQVVISTSEKADPPKAVAFFERKEEPKQS